MPAEPFPKHRVYVATKPLDPIEIDDVPIDDLSTVDDTQWRMLPHLICEGVVEGLMPTLWQATLLWRFGSMRREWGEGSVVPGVSAIVNLSDEFSDFRAKLDLRGMYVLITLVDPEKKWIFYVAEEELTRWVQNNDVVDSEYIKGGDQVFTAYDLSYFLAKQQIAGKSANFADRVFRPIDFNTGSGEGREPDPAKRANRSVIVSDVMGPAPYNVQLVYDFDHGPDAELWTAEQIVEHLLFGQGPRDQDDQHAPVKYLLDPDADDYLNWYVPSTRGIEGRSVLQVIDEVIDRRRCLTAWWTTEMAGTTPDILACILHVSSLAATSLALPDSGVLPPAATIETFDPNAYVMMQPPQISRGKRKYHRVRVRGARRTTTLSATNVQGEDAPSPSNYAYPFAKPINSTIVKNWSEDDETAYLEGVSGIDAGYGSLTLPEKRERNDHYRKTPRFERVFQYFAIETVSGAGFELSPRIVQATESVAGDVIMERRNMRIHNTTPLRVGFDYADPTAPTENGDPQFGEELLRPFCLIYLPIGSRILPTTLGEGIDHPGDAVNTDGGWRHIDKLTTNLERGFSTEDVEGPVTTFRFKGNFSFHALIAENGFRLGPSSGIMAHYLIATEGTAGADTLASAGGEPSKYPIGLSYEALLVTVTVEWDAYCEAIWPEAEVEASPVMELLIQTSDRLRYDYLTKGTVYDINEDGTLKQSTVGGAIRDDRAICETIARLAHLWYSQDRAGMILRFDNLVAPFEVGDLITTLGTGAAEETVNAVVSQIQYDLANGKTTITCGYQELDFDNIV